MSKAGRLALALVPVTMLGCQDQPREARLLAVQGQCDAALTACVARDDAVDLRLRLGPEPVVLLKPFQVELQIALPAGQVESAFVDLRMAEMEMGLNRYRLIPSEGSWKAQAVLGVCAEVRTDWLASVEVNGNGNLYKAEFTFSAASDQESAE